MAISTFSLLRGDSERLAELDPEIPAGVQVFERDTGKMKIGDGFRRWSQLEYFLPESEVRAAIEEAISGLGQGGEVGVDQLALQIHVNSETPHPVYDDGPSLLLLYENAKV